MAGRDRRTGDGLLVAALAAGLTYAEAATQAGVSERTVRRRLAEPGFAEQVTGARAETVRHTAARLTALAGQAVDAFAALIGENTAPPTRLRAAHAVLDHGVRLREAEELEARVTALERTAARAGGHPLRAVPGGRS